LQGSLFSLRKTILAASVFFAARGTQQMLALLDDIIEGRATGETLELLEKLAWQCKKVRFAIVKQRRIRFCQR
jgi:hypothetical protein